MDNRRIIVLGDGCVGRESLVAHMAGMTGIEVVHGDFFRSPSRPWRPETWNLINVWDEVPYLQNLDDKSKVWEGQGKKEEQLEKLFQKKKPFIHNIFFK